MDKLLIEDTQETCSGCGKLVESGYIVFQKGKNKFLCSDCVNRNQLKKKMSIIVTKENSFFFKLLGLNNVYEVITSKNILLPKYIPEIQLKILIDSNIEVTIK